MAIFNSYVKFSESIVDDSDTRPNGHPTNRQWWFHQSGFLGFPLQWLLPFVNELTPLRIAIKKCDYPSTHWYPLQVILGLKPLRSFPQQGATVPYVCPY